MAQSKSEPVRIVGDSLIGRSVNGENIREVIGNVIMTQGDVQVTCERALQYLTRNEAELIGNVVAVQDTITIRSERGYYYGNTKTSYTNKRVFLNDTHVELEADSGYYYFDENRADFYGNVKMMDTVNTLSSVKLTYYNKENRAVAVGSVAIEDTASTVYADSLIHFRDSAYTEGFRNVIVLNKKNKMAITGAELYNDNKKNYSKVVGNPVMLQIDSTKSGTLDTLIISSKVMEAIKDSGDVMIATDSVKIIRGDFASRTNHAIMYRDENRIFTAKKKEEKVQPIMWYSETQVVGDTLNIYLKDKRLDWIFIKKDAFILSQKENQDFRFDQVSGDSLKLHFENDKLNNTDVLGNVLSIYFIFEDTKPNGLLKASSENGRIYFKESKVDEVRLFGSVKSEYHPENLVEGNEKDFTLPSFVIHKNRPSKKSVIGKEQQRALRLLRE